MVNFSNLLTSVEEGQLYNYLCEICLINSAINIKIFLMLEETFQITKSDMTRQNRLERHIRVLCTVIGDTAFAEI
jgi:hypothetical protein